MMQARRESRRSNFESRMSERKVIGCKAGSLGGVTGLGELFFDALAEGGLIGGGEGSFEVLDGELGLAGLEHDVAQAIAPLVGEDLRALLGRPGSGFFG